MPPSGRSGGTFAVDLDETLVRVNTFPLFIRFALWRLLLQGDVRAASGLVLALFRRKVLRGPHARLKAEVHSAGERLRAQAVERWSRRVLADSTDPEVRQLVDAWDGPTLLTTSAPGVYAEVIGRLAGFTTTHASCFSDGSYVENVHERKAERVQALLDRPLARTITDDPVLDRPLLLLAAERLLVERTSAGSSVSAWSPSPEGGTGAP